MDDIRFTDSAMKSLDKPIKRFRGVALAGFHLDWIDLRFELAAVGNQEVNLNIISVLLVIIASVEEQRITVANQLLCDSVLENHTLVNGQIIVKDCLMSL